MLRLKLTDWQREYVESDSKYNLLIAGRRAGKTHAMQARIVRNALRRPGYTSLYLTPDGALCNEVFRNITNDKHIKTRISRTEIQPVRQIFWIDGSRSYFRMFDRPDKALGMSYDHVDFDEIQKLDSLTGRDTFMRVIRPLIMDTQGTLTIAGQWRGEACWWHKWYKENIDNPDMRLWNVPTWKGIKFLPHGEDHEEIQDAKKMMTPQLYAQEIACIPAGNANAAFDYLDIKECIKGLPLRKGEPGRKYMIGADLGKVRDPSAWVVMDVKDKAVVHAECRPIGEKHAKGAKKLQELCQRFNNARAYIDVTGGATGGKKHKDAYLKFYRQHVKSLGKYVFSKQSKSDMVEKLILALQNQTIMIADGLDNIIGQLSSFEAYPSKYGGWHYHGPGGQNDDLVAALLMVNDAVDRAGPSGGASAGDSLGGFTRT